MVNIISLLSSLTQIVMIVLVGFSIRVVVLKRDIICSKGRFGIVYDIVIVFKVNSLGLMPVNNYQSDRKKFNIRKRLKRDTFEWTGTHQPYTFKL